MLSDADAETFRAILSKLTLSIGDILDGERYSHQFLPQPVKPVHPSQMRRSGRLAEALDLIQPNEMYQATGGSMNCAWKTYQAGIAPPPGILCREQTPEHTFARTGLPCIAC